MSFEYTLYENDDPAASVLLTLSLSNTSHYIWQEEAGLSMSRVNRDNPSDVIVTAIHTTIHDKNRLAFDVSYLERYFDKLGDDMPISPLLTELLEIAESNGCNFIFV